MVLALVGPAWTRPLQDPDSWWLAWAGEQALASVFPRTNELSFTAPLEPWVCHERLVALIYGAVGIERVPLVRGLVCSALGGMLLVLARQRDSGWATVLALTLVLPGVSMAISARPMAWGLLLLAATQWVLLRDRPWSGPIAAILVALWAWVHGSFPLGLVLLALYRWRWLPLAALGLLLRPQPLELFQLVGGYAQGSGTQALVHAYVEEWGWLRPDSLASGLRLLALSILAGLAVADRRGRWLVPLLLPLALRHQRFAAVASLALLPYAADWLAQRLPARPLPSAQPWLHGALFGLALAATPMVQELPHVSPRKTWSDLELGAQLAVQGVPVFWDARNDCYPPEVYAEGMRIALREPSWVQVLDRWEVQQVVTRDRGLALALEAEGWQLRLDSPVLVLTR